MSCFAEKASACIQGFDELCNNASIWTNYNREDNGRDDYNAETALWKLKNELMRFRLWTVNTGAHEKGEGSLEHRLRDSSNIREQVARLLQDLEELLNDAKGIIAGAVIPWDQEPNPMELEDDESNDNDSLESFLTEEPLSTELSQVIDSVVEDVNCLFRLSVSIHDPSPHDCFKQASSSDTLDIEATDLWYLRLEFPMASNIVLERFARAISHQREYLRYLELRQQNLPSRFDENTDDEARTGAARAETHNPSEFVSSPEQLDLILGASTAYVEQAPVPDFPEGAENGPVKCPFCSMMVSISSRPLWKKHVLSDLNPYICMEESCPAPEQNLQDHHHWVQHIQKHHWKVWSCCFGCEEVFTSPDLMAHHIFEIHPEASTSIQGGSLLSSLVSTCEKPKPEGDSAECPLCKETQSNFVEYRQHIGCHYRYLALFKLPQLPSPDETKYDGQNKEVADLSNDTHMDLPLRGEDVVYLICEGLTYSVNLPLSAISDGQTRVIDVKDHVASIWKMPRERAHRAVLFYDGDELKGLETCIRDFGITHKSILLVTLPPTTGPPPFRRKLTGKSLSRPHLPKGDSLIEYQKEHSESNKEFLDSYELDYIPRSGDVERTPRESQSLYESFKDLAAAR